MQTEMANQQEDTLTPYSRLLHDASMRSMGVAVDMHGELKRFLSEQGTKQPKLSPKSLPKLNVEFVSEVALSAWASVVAHLNGEPLPGRPGTVRGCIC